jgi:hypothetical protein
VRKPTTYSLIVIALALVATASIVGVLLIPLRPRAAAASISANIPLLRIDPRFGSAAFYVTNNEPHGIRLACLEVQVPTNGGWKTVSKKTSRLIDPTAPNDDWSGYLESGMYRKIYVDPAERWPWRVCVTYLVERRGLLMLLSDIEIALRRRSLSQWGRWHSWGGAKQVVSQEIPQ